MTFDLNEVAQLPDTFSLEDFRVVCHISKRTARYYLRNGLIPCEINDKKTHCYSIKRQELINALKEYQKCPYKFAVPKQWDDEKQQSQPLTEQKICAITYLSDKDLTSPTLKKYYVKKLEDCLDLLDCKEIERITGYSRKTINRWCEEGKLHCIRLKPHVLVQKKKLLPFLTSKEYNSIMSKSKVHLEDIHEIYRKIHRGG